MKSGDKHYKAFVGRPEEYDIIGAHIFNTLINQGLRSNNTLLDIGCGSLRAGKYLICYLDKSKYTGIDPNGWLIDDAIKYEIGDMHIVKDATLIKGDEIIDSKFDFILAHSIFTHADPEIIINWCKKVKSVLSGKFLFTIRESEVNNYNEGWTYPNNTKYTFNFIKELFKTADLEIQRLNIPHPRGQTWVLAQ